MEPGCATYEQGLQASITKPFLEIQGVQTCVYVNFTGIQGVSDLTSSLCVCVCVCV